MKNIKAIRTLQYCASQEGFDIPLDNFTNIDNKIEANKETIRNMMGGNKVIVKDTETQIKVDDEVKELGFNQYLKVLIEIPYFKNLYVLRRFIRDCGAISFYDNKTTEEMSYRIINQKGYEEMVRIPQGMKITRALKFFTLGDDKLLNMLQTKYSQIINTSVITGRMCVSVDPMDFLTMSVNNNNWRSCMALDGEYAAGALSYAVDKHTFMVYLKSDKEDENLKGVPSDVKWNSKKWRCLMYFDEEYETIISTKQYPFTSSKLMEEAIEMIKEVFGLENWTYKTIDSLYDLNISTYSKGLIFNDLEAMNSKMLIHCLVKDLDKDDRKIFAGEEVLCPNCNGDIIDYGGSFICSGCAERSICENCGGPINSNDELYCVDGMEICYDCMSECCVVCECCYETFWSDDPDVVYTEDGTVYCSGCFDEME